MGLSNKKPRIPQPQKQELLGIDVDSSRIELIERLKFQVTFAETMFRSLILVNGGAIIGLFTFLGNIAAEGGRFGINTTLLWTAFGFFALGLAFSLVSVAGAYFSQQYYYEVTVEELLMAQHFRVSGECGEDGRHEPHRKGLIAQGFGVGGAVLSMLGFIIGAATSLVAVLPK